MAELIFALPYIAALVVGVFTGSFFAKRSLAILTAAAGGGIGIAYYEFIVKSVYGNALADGLGFAYMVLFPSFLFLIVMWATAFVSHRKKVRNAS